ncbi:GNAT family N-acetyltransferase [Yersinia wautersii]|uniref:GNAT family N-acetyltransferase n=2 Tax=Yersinia wautersii TaxID=1341643 RepID=UPI0004200FAE|nr:GNAT family N-acetyltransferase [Yersinia wautersii]
MKITNKLLISIVSAISFSAYSNDINDAKVCFYELENFSGESFCAYEGESQSPINSDFDNEIKSISIPPGMVITLYDGIDFSGIEKKLKNDVNLKDIKSFGLYNKINSYRIDPAVCFYTEDKFQGDSMCLAASQHIDLYSDTEGFANSERIILPIRNDSIKSIKVPIGMMTTIYKNDNFNAPFFELTENINLEKLKTLAMDNQLTSLKVSEKKGLHCNQKCIILEKHEINLPESFGEYWHDSRLVNKQVILSFNSRGGGGNDEYQINLKNGPEISILKNEITFSDYNMITKFSFNRIDNLDNLSFILQIEKDVVKVQYIQTLDDQLIDLSPITSFKWQKMIDDIPTLTIQNKNTDKPLILNKSIITADTGDQNWEKRDIGNTSQIICAFTPFLNLYNYIVQGTCRQLDGIIFSADQYFNSNTKGKTLHIAGKSRPLKPSSLTEKSTDRRHENKMILTYIDNVNNNQSLSLPAVAKACMVSIHSLLSTRQTRQVRPQCIDWTLEIMTDFTLLFGGSLRTWNTEYFGRIIQSIITTGSTGVAVENTEAEKRLSEAVKKTVMSQSIDSAISQIKSAFDYAQLNYLSYSLFYSSDDTPSHVEQLPLGIYELLLASFVYKPTLPTIIEHSEPVEQHELAFEIEVLPSLFPEDAKLSDTEIEHAQTLRRKISETIAQWGQQYQGTHTNDDVDEEIDSGVNANLSKLLHAGHIVTGIIHRRLVINRPGEIYVVVKLRGEIIAIVLADRFNNRDEVELVASATLPDYVLSPHNEGTVRGAGTAAVYELARYLQQQGAKTLFSEVISQPSARVKQKVGFTFKSEF